MNAQPIPDKTFGIGEFSDTNDIHLFIEQLRVNGNSNYGLSLLLEEDTINKTINSIFKENSLLELSVILQDVYNYLESSDNNFALIINYKGKEETLIKCLETNKLLSRIYVPTNNYPVNDSLKANKGQLLIFNTSEKKFKTKLIHDYKEYVFEYPAEFDEFRNSVYARDFISGEQAFVATKRFTTEYLTDKESTRNLNSISTNPIFLEYILDCWMNTGQKPNFIYYSSIHLIHPTRAVIYLINLQPQIKGTINGNGLLLNGITWKHSKESLTRGKFSFPVKENDIVFEPSISGYSFTPVNFTTELGEEITSINFIGQKFKINEGIKAYYSFDGNIENEIAPFQRHNGGVFENDPQKGQVLKFENKHFISLAPAEKYNLLNQSFTVSIHVKITEKGLLRDNCILGNDNNIYRKGLHINIRKGLPYFGFFTNDVTSSERIEPMKWYRLVVRYNIENGEQSIFLDGRKVAQSWNHPSFIGSDSIQLGTGIKQENHLEGFLDDLYIWERALSDNEIKILSLGNIDKVNRFKHRYIIIWVAVLLCILAIVYYQLRKKYKFKSRNIVVQQNINSATIELFGGFKVFDESGTNLTDLFAPKTRELFLLLLIYTLKNPKGISKSELTETIWGDVRSKKVSNSRSVAFNRLKGVLNKMTGVEVIFETNHWRLKMGREVFCDYQHYIQLIEEERTSLNEFIPFLKKGKFLPEVKKEWLLDFRSAFNFELIDKLLQLIKETKHAELIIVTCEYILGIDDLNQQALFYLLQEMLKSGNKNKAGFVFNKFAETYKKVHKSTFPYTLNTFMEVDINQL